MDFDYDSKEIRFSVGDEQYKLHPLWMRERSLEEGTVDQNSLQRLYDPEKISENLEIKEVNKLEKDIKKIKVVVNGAGASAMACTNLFIKSGVNKKNITMLDRKGVIHKKRGNLNEWKSIYAIDTKDRTLKDAIKNADVFLGLSAKGALTKKMVKKMY